jgi:branched-subunit amino acid transport protein
MTMIMKSKLVPDEEYVSVEYVPLVISVILVIPSVLWRRQYFQSLKAGANPSSLLILAASVNATVTRHLLYVNGRRANTLEIQRSIISGMLFATNRRY